MDAIVSKTTIALPLGIQCIELSIKDADDVIKDFIIKNRNIFDFSNAPSWKFPHMNIEKLDVLSMMDIYRKRSMSEEKQYLELMEILVDRLYFSLITTYQYLASSETVPTGAISERGDCHQSPPRDLTKLSLDEKSHKPFQAANVAELLRQIHGRLLSLDIINPLTKGGNKIPDKVQNKKVTRVENMTIRHSLTQTEFSSLEGCQSCFLSQNLLKLLADTISLCLKVFTDGEESQITKFRRDLKQSVWLYSQRAVVIKWCESIESDCHVMLEKAEDVLKNNIIIKQEFENLELKAQHQIMVNETVNEELRQKLNACEEELQMERKRKRKQIKQKDTANERSNELERQLLEMQEQGQIRELENGQLKNKIDSLTETQDKLRSAQLQCSADLQEARRGMEKAVEDKNASFRRCSGLEAKMDLKDQEIMNLKKLVEKFQNSDREKSELRNEMESARQSLQISKEAEQRLEKVKEGYEDELLRQKESLELAESKIELLTLYPDLNGPINPPTREVSNPLQAMENQLKSNMLRMDVLQAQTERLNSTLIKLRSHLKSK